MKKIRKTPDGWQPLYTAISFFSKMNLQLLIENGENLILIHSATTIEVKYSISVLGASSNKYCYRIELHIIELKQESLIAKSTRGISIENNVKNNISGAPAREARAAEHHG